MYAVGGPAGPPDRPDDPDDRLVRPPPALRAHGTFAGLPLAPTRRCPDAPRGRKMRDMPTFPRLTSSRAAATAASLGRAPDRALDRARCRGIPGRFLGLSHLRRGGCRREGGRNRPPGHRQALQHRQELQGPRDLGDEDLGQRRRRRGRARSPVRGRPPRRRAHGRRAGAQGHALADRRLRHDHAHQEHREHPRDLDHLPREPGRRRARHLAAASSTTGARTASPRRGRRTPAPISIGTTGTAGAVAVARARTRRPSRTAARRPSRRRRRAPSAISWPAASSAGGSRSGSPSPSTSRAGWSCGRTATPTPISRAT